MRRINRSQSDETLAASPAMMSGATIPATTPSDFRTMPSCTEQRCVHTVLSSPARRGGGVQGGAALPSVGVGNACLSHQIAALDVDAHIIGYTDEIGQRHQCADDPNKTGPVAPTSAEVLHRVGRESNGRLGHRCAPPPVVSHRVDSRLLHHSHYILVRKQDRHAHREVPAAG
eukprot:SAG22_NODE_26_length_29806_cov_19.885381_2_plen_173_part_00